MSARHLSIRKSFAGYRPRPDALWKNPHAVTTESNDQDMTVAKQTTKDSPAQAQAQVGIQTAVILTRLGPDAWAELLRFTELRCLGSVAVTCTLFSKCTFEDIRFWMAYAGIGPRYSELTNSITASVMRAAVRRVAFGLEGAWGKAFAGFAAEHNSADVFSEAARMICGIRSDDDELETARFIGVLVGKLGTFDASCKQTRQLAEAVVTKAQECEASLPRSAMPYARAAPPVKRLRMALEASIQHSEAESAEEESTSCGSENADTNWEHESDLVEEDTDEKATKMRSCDDNRLLRTGLVAAATAAGALATSLLSEELFVDEGLQEFTVLAALIPAGFVYARSRQQAVIQKTSAVVSKLTMKSKTQ